LPLVAANDVHYHIPARQPLHDVLTATRLRCTVAELGEHRFPNAERHLKSPAEMQQLFRGSPELVARTQEVASRCRFSLDELRYEYPHELCPSEMTPTLYLYQLTWRGATNRYPQGVTPKVRSLIEHELALIADLQYEAYFLTVWDLVRFARERGILCQGRGSAANSAVCYCLGVTSVDPDRIDVKPGRKWWRFPGENPGENGSAHACSSMKSEDGASAPFHRLCRGAPKCEVTWRTGKRFASRCWYTV
jgi:error-prone DNA polymerase